MSLKTINNRWCKWILLLLRLVVGGVFIFSGFVKAIDPWGTIYKLADYLASFQIGFLNPYLLFLAISIATIEFMFGVFILLGCYRRSSPIILFLIMLVMLPLTFYIAVTGNVADCGCFGDAIIISNWGTFWKNIFLTLAIIYLIFYNKSLKNIYGVSVQWIVGLFSLIFISLIAFLGYFYQPLIDFRPFKVGSKIVNQEVTTDNIDEQNYKFVYERNGVKQTFSLDNLPDDNEWDFVERINENITSSVTKPTLLIYNDGEDITHDVIKQDGEQILLLFPSLGDVEISYTYIINELYDFTKSHGIDLIGLTSTSKDNINEWNDLSMSAYPMYNTDDSTLKQIARGNPAIVYLKDGNIAWKRSLRSLSNEEMLNPSNDLALLVNEMDDSKQLGYMSATYILSLVLLLIINRSHKVIKIKAIWHRKNKKME